MKNHKRRILEKKLHTVAITRDSHTGECASEVKQLLHNDFEVPGFVNPGSEIKFIKERVSE